MDIENTTLQNEVNAIVNSGPSTSNWYYEAALLAGGKVYPLYKVINIDIVRDYENAFADTVMLEGAMGGGTFATDIVPFKEDLRLMLVKSPLGERGTAVDQTRQIETKLLRATLVTMDQPATAGSDSSITAGDNVGDLVSMRTFYVQLQELSMEQIRLVTIGTVVRASKPGDVIMAFLSQVGKSINVDEAAKIKGVTMIEAQNQEIQDHIIIPHGTPITEMPDMIQNEMCGVYSSGLGFYLQNLMWYVWPPYDLTRFDRYQKTVTILLLPENKLNSIERTFRVTANQVIIIVTGGAKHIDQSENLLMNLGNAVRFSDSRKMFEGFGEVKGNKVVAKRGQNNSEFVGIQRANKLNSVSSGGVSNNIYDQASQIAARNGSRMKVNWQNSDPDLLTPDMPVTIIFPSKGLPVPLQATMLKTHTYIQSGEGGLTQHKHMTNTEITLFVEKDLPALKEYEAENKVDQYSRPLAM